MAAPKLKSISPRLSATVPRVAALSSSPDATPRLRGRRWMERRAAWLRRHPLCVHCRAEGRTELATQVDHIRPLCDGGADDESNYQSLCEPCHAVKTAREASERAGRGVG